MYFILGWLGVIFEFHGYNFSCPHLAIHMLWMLLGVDFFVMVSLIHLKKKIFLCCFWHCSWYFFALTACYQISQSIKQQKKPTRLNPKPLFLYWQKNSYWKRQFFILLCQIQITDEKIRSNSKSNIRCIKNRTNHSSKIIMSLVWFLLNQTLLILNVGIYGFLILENSKICLWRIAITFKWQN